MTWFNRQAEELGIGFTRVPAVDGRLLDEATLKSHHSLCPADRAVSFGELGCFLSHANIWARIVESGAKWSFVAEDDLHLSNAAPAFLKSDSWLPPSIGLVKAETMLTMVRASSRALASPFGHDIRVLRSFHGGTAGYFISFNAAARLLDYAKYRCEPVDHFIFEFARSQEETFIIAQLDAAIGIQNHLLEDEANLPSDLDQDRHEFWNFHPLSRKPRGVRKIRRELQRVTKSLLDPARRIVLSAMRNDLFRRIEFDNGAD